MLNSSRSHLSVPAAAAAVAPATKAAAMAADTTATEAAPPKPPPKPPPRKPPPKPLLLKERVDGALLNDRPVKDGDLETEPEFEVLVCEVDESLSIFREDADRRARCIGYVSEPCSRGTPG